MRCLWLLGLVLLTGCYDQTVSKEPPPTVARICKDGSYIYHHADGSYRAWNGYRVEDIDKVCVQ